jgi:peptidoglycan/LPS O-acetylase OafA/YrhL
MNNRDLNLDFVKGFLVISMVVYHTLNYYCISGYDVIKYVRFVTGSFIFISGYIVSEHYLKKYETDKVNVSKRLIIRGLKILLLFTVLNVSINMLGIQSHKAQFSIEQYLNNLRGIYIEGNFSYTVFQMLVPISYFLLLAPIILIFHNWKKTIGAIMLIALLSCLIFNLNIFNLSGIIIGLAGFAIGLLSNKSKSIAIKGRIIILALLAISISVMEYFDKNILYYTFGIILVLKLVYDFSATTTLTNMTNRMIILLGRYSLLCYLLQIFFLQAMHKLFITQRYGLGYELFIISIITSFYLIIISKMLDFSRSRLPIIDKVYKIFFS